MNYFHIPYIIPTALLAVALILKFPTLIRAWRDHDVRATTVLLTCATMVLIVVTPVNIERLNQWTGVPNMASPTAYSFLTTFCATALTMIMRWREEPSPRRQRRIRLIYWIYAGIIVALWVTFLMADVPEPRIYDLDTYYASTPWMREHILLYLLAHGVSVIVATAMLWRWFPEITNPWLRAGVVCLQLGFPSGVIFDICKLLAISARWFGTDWDDLSTIAAPPFALLEAILVAFGFIVPQAGPSLHKWFRDQREYRRLRPLWREVNDLPASAATARFGLWVPLELRLVQRRQRIHDALRILTPYLDTGLYQRAQAAADGGHSDDETLGLAGVLTIRAALQAHREGTPTPARAQEQELAIELHEHLDAISQAVHRPRLIDDIRRRLTSTESTDTHAS
ncbi:MAB_1171c family putative transporter [Streptomyces coerulescens]|uniref:MAB_1171c family putative transporter n=1 Tax=Streptomyces coerulescens TaxID=29304 RepID=A0ABW0CVV7_STRCD